MTDYLAQVQGDWTSAGTGGDPSHRPTLAADYALISCSDATGQPAANITPAPNMCVWDVKITEAVLDAIEADPDYTVLQSYEVTEDVV